MQRRTLLGLGAVSALLLAAAGGAAALWQPARTQGRLTAPARQMLGAVTQAVLGQALAPPALQAQLDRLQATIAGFPPPLQAEIDQLLTLLCHPAGRVALLGLGSAWADASQADVAAALQRLRTSSLALRRQAYRALRDLCNSAYFADPAAWPQLGYPGPRPI